MKEAIITRVVERFQVTVPPAIRELFDLRVGDLFEWRIDGEAREIRIIPKRPQLITPQLAAVVREVREKQKTQASTTAPAPRR